MKKDMVNYTKGKIYKLYSDIDDMFYIGSTTLPLGKRRKSHKKKAEFFPDRNVYAHFNNISWDNVKIQLIEKYPCASIHELIQRERHHIEILKPQLNTTIPILTDEEKEKKKQEQFAKLTEYMKQNPEVKKKSDKKSYEKRKEQILKQKHEYYEANKNAKKEWQKNYTQTHKEEMSSKRKERVNCPQCSKNISQGALRRHIKESCPNNPLPE